MMFSIYKEKHEIIQVYKHELNILNTQKVNRIITLHLLTIYYWAEYIQIFKDTDSLVV